MTIDEKTSNRVLRASPFALILFCAAFMLSTMFLANTLLILRAARLLDEVGAQCAFSAARGRNLAEARRAIDKVLQNHQPDGFFLHGPITSVITLFVDDTKAGPIKAPFATVQTSLVSWIPAPQLFFGAFESGKSSDMIAPNQLRFSALHSSPRLTLYDETQKSGRSSI